MKLKYGFLLMVIIAGCKSQQKINTANTGMITTPQVVVYKTKGDYHDLVPVILSDDKTSIVSYPAPTDLLNGDFMLTPTLLNNDYLLDNRGISKNVAFLNIDYSTYSKLKQTPSVKELYLQILDKDPLIEMCDCGSRANFSSITAQLNQLITTKQLLKQCQSIK